MRSLARRLLFLAALCLSLAACQTEVAPATAIAAAGPSRAAWLPEHYVISPRSAIPPERVGEGEIAFRVAPGRCTAYADGSGPGDCATGSVRSALSGGSIYRLEHQYMHSFEILVPADFAASAGGARFSVARWQGADGPNRRLFDLELDARRGLTFRGATCVPPAGFGAWQRVFLRVRWAADRTGFLELRCGDGVVHSAPLIYARGAEATAVTERGATVQRFEYQLGLIHDGRGAGSLRGATAIRMRRISERRLFVIFGLEAS